MFRGGRLSGTILPLQRFLDARRFLRSIPQAEISMTIVALQPLVALIFGILILIMPRLLNYLIAIYLIIVGLTGLFPQLFAGGPTFALLNP
jgi:hypothetical protein